MGTRGTMTFESPSPEVLKSPKLGQRKKMWLAPATSDDQTKPMVRMISVIVPAHNEEHYLGKTLEALQRQTYRWFETIVIANGCSDHTADMARGRCQRLIVLSQKSLGVARNLGARMAKGQMLLFLDADTVLEPTALERIASQF